MCLRFVVLLVGYVAVACCANVVIQQPKALVGPWSDTGVAVARDKAVTINVALQRSGFAELQHQVDARASPGSPQFRQWMSFEEARGMMKASPLGIAAVEGWLKGAGVNYSTTPLRDQFHLRLTISEAEGLFETFFHVVRHDISGQVWHRAGPIHVPSNVAPHVAAVFGVHGLPTTPRSLPKPQILVDVGPTEIRKTYQVTGRGSGNKKARQAVAEFQGQFANAADLVTFFRILVPDAKPGDDKVYANVGNQGSGYGIEALLDIEYIMGLAPGVLTEFWAWRNFDFCSDLKNWTTTMINTADIPVVFSISYGWQGDLSQIGCQQSEVTEIDKDFATLAGRGISIIFASGDSGSGYQSDKLWPSWPASSPYVTAVGSTCFTDRSMAKQMATTQFGSGSGFSDMFKQGPWQIRAVSQYLSTATGLPPANLYPKDGRATADVSALGEGYEVYEEGRRLIVGGTSASAPAFAALVSLVNDGLVTAGKSPLGYLNPWLYNNTDMFTDITLGSDKISRGGEPLQYGFDCTAGWDPATGLGVPIFPKMKANA